VAIAKNHSVQKAFAVLSAFRPSDGWVTCAELSRRAGVPEATGYRVIETLADVGAAIRGPQGGYRPGPLLLSLSRKAVLQDCPHTAANEILSDLSDRLNVTTHLARLEDGMVTYVAKAATRESCEMQTYPGARFEPYSTASGKVLLSALSRRALDDFLLEGELVPLTRHTITEQGALVAELEKVQREGYALDNREFHPAIACVAVPVFDGDGQPVASISASERADSMSRQRQQMLRKALLKASQDLRGRIPMTALAADLAWPQLRGARRPVPERRFGT